MELRININTENAAFDGDDRGPELGRILRDLADKLEGGAFGPMNTATALRDINGNRVGMAQFSAEAEQQA